MFCRNCGKEIPEDTRFCPECGTMVSSSEGDVDKASTTEGRKATAQERDNAADKAARKAIRRAKRKKIRGIIGAVFSVIVIVLLIMAFAGVFDNAASDLTNGAYGRRGQEYTYVEKSDSDTTQNTNDIQEADETQRNKSEEASDASAEEDVSKTTMEENGNEMVSEDTSNVEKSDTAKSEQQGTVAASAVAAPVADIHGIYEYDNGETAVMSAEVGIYTDDDSDYLSIEALSYGDRILAEFSGNLEEMDTNVYRAIDMDFGTILVITFDEGGMSVVLDHAEIQDVEVLEGYYQKTGEIDFEHVG